MPEGNANLGDLLYEMGDEALTGEGLALLLRMVLMEKRGYRAVSVNLAGESADLKRLAGEFARWKGVDLVAAYYHPDLGLMAANPKNADQMANFGPLRRRELLVVYAGNGKNSSGEGCLKAAKLAAALFQGEKAKPPAELLRGGFTVKKVKKAATGADKAQRVWIAARKGIDRRSAPKAAAKTAVRGGRAAALPAVKEGPRAAAPVRMTPRYSVTVTNELFHNGNVEAWKRIIDSYKTKYPALQIYIYYEGERVRDINSLFNWGKVKHGSSIQFAVAGNDIRDVSKLQRYLAQGASNQFEAFIRNAVSDVLRLF